MHPSINQTVSSGGAHREVGALEVQGGAGAAEGVQVVVVQQDVDGDAALTGRLHQVTQQVYVGEHIHHQGDHLGHRARDSRYTGEGEGERERETETETERERLELG